MRYLLLSLVLALAGCEDPDAHTELDELRAELDALRADHDALRAEYDELLAYVEVDAEANAVRFVGANVYVQSGSGETWGEPNGLGNLIVGYDEPNEYEEYDNKTGSHNLVVGPEHSYAGTGGVVFGHRSTVSGEGNSALGGDTAFVNGQGNVVVGGLVNSLWGGADTSVGDIRWSVILGSAYEGVGVYNGSDVVSALRPCPCE